MADASESGNSTPNTSRWTSQAHAVEDRLKEETIGLVTLDDFRKRRAEALEAAQDVGGSGATTPEGREPAAPSAFKKRKKAVKKGILSFNDDEGDGDTDTTDTNTNTQRSNTPAENSNSDAPLPFKKRGLRPSAAVAHQPKALTKSALLKEAQMKEALRKEYTQLQEAVKATEFVLPFVFYDGKNAPGGMCRMKKGDHIWLFLERARKVGADKADKSRRDWARISVDDLMLVKGDIIIPQASGFHQDFYYFIVNHTVGYLGPLFVYSSQPTPATPQDLLPSSKERKEEDVQAGLMTAAERRQQAAAAAAAAVTGLDDSELEGFNDDPNLTKVVDRRWYERNKHIYPASSWEEFDEKRDYSSGVRKDKDGNNMFFSRTR